MFERGDVVAELTRLQNSRPNCPVLDVCMIRHVCMQTLPPKKVSNVRRVAWRMENQTLKLKLKLKLPTAAEGRIDQSWGDVLWLFKLPSVYMGFHLEV